LLAWKKVVMSYVKVNMSIPEFACVCVKKKHRSLVGVAGFETNI